MRDVGLDRRFQTAYYLLHVFEEMTVGGRHFKLCVWGGNDRVSMSRRSVIHEDHFLLRIQICPRLRQEVIETLSIHSANSC